MGQRIIKKWKTLEPMRLHGYRRNVSSSSWYHLPSQPESLLLASCYWWLRAEDKHSRRETVLQQAERSSVTREHKAKRFDYGKSSRHRLAEILIFCFSSTTLKLLNWRKLIISPLSIVRLCVPINFLIGIECHSSSVQPSNWHSRNFFLSLGALGLACVATKDKNVFDLIMRIDGSIMSAGSLRSCASDMPITNRLPNANLIGSRKLLPTPDSDEGSKSLLTFPCRVSLPRIVSLTVVFLSLSVLKSFISSRQTSSADKSIDRLNDKAKRVNITVITCPLLLVLHVTAPFSFQTFISVPSRWLLLRPPRCQPFEWHPCQAKPLPNKSAERFPCTILLRTKHEAGRALRKWEKSAR